MTEIVMPRLSDSMDEGTVLTWLKQVGDEVAVGEELVEIETDKANMAYESDRAGTLLKILAEEGDTLEVGAPIAVIGDGSEQGQAEQAADAAPVAAATAVVRDEVARESAPVAPGTAAVRAERSGGVKASPIARRIARERGIDLAAVKGTGPTGRIVRADVEGFSVGAVAPASNGGPPSVAAETAKGAVEYVELSKLQQTVARRMSESKATAPHFYLEAEVDVSLAVEARHRLKVAAVDGETVPSFNDLVVKACAQALREHPRANGAYRDGRLEFYSRVNIGIAVAAEDVLVVPTVFDADRKGLAAIAEESRLLAQRVREGTVTPPELAGGTFTVSNLGMYGIDSFSAIVNAPQAAILAVGSIAERPAVRDGQIEVGQFLHLTLSCDHRILYGATAAEFLATVRRQLEEPLLLAL
jgi:pyruvate dehydrogenase E2 component (dihydrolipoamide acetyltransferase)